LIDPLEFDSPEHVMRYDRQTGRIVSVEQGILRAIEEGQQDELGDLPEWQKDEVEIAQAIAEDDGQRFINAPDKFDFHEYRQMEGFIGSIEVPEVAEQLWRAIRGKGAFRHFKDTARRLGLLERWYRYRDNAMKEYVIAWAEANNVPYEDDLKDRESCNWRQAG
jgi:hypothetical protein